MDLLLQQGIKADGATMEPEDHVDVMAQHAMEIAITQIAQRQDVSIEIKVVMANVKETMDGI